MFGLFDSKSERAAKKIQKIVKEMWTIGKKLSGGKDLKLAEAAFIKEPTELLIKHLVETEIHLEKIGTDLIKLTNEQYLDNVISNLEKEYKKSPMRISDDHWQYINDLTMDYRIQNEIPISHVRWRF